MNPTPLLTNITLSVVAGVAVCAAGYAMYQSNQLEKEKDYWIKETVKERIKRMKVEGRR